MLSVSNHNHKPCSIRVPQGSELSPLLLIIYVTDMSNNIDGLLLQFADDSTMVSWDTTESILQEKLQKTALY